MFSEEQKASLSDKLDKSKVRQRKQGDGQVSYIEGWHAIAEANRIFGFGKWSRETISMECVNQDGVKCTYLARVRITIHGEGGYSLIREGTGTGHGVMKNAGNNHESASKEAETDAMKRAFMTFGNPFGLALYDKDQRDVGTSADIAEAEAKQAAEQRGIDQTWTDENIRICNDTDWDDTSFKAWKAEIKETFRFVRSREPDMAQHLTDVIQERTASMIERLKGRDTA